MRAMVASLLLAVSALALPASAQDRFADVQIQVTPIRDGLALLTGEGGNIVASVGADGTFIIDDQYAQLSDKIRAALATLGDQPVRFILNTHFHGDHTGGNQNFGAAGAVIVAQDNVRERMSRDQFLQTFKRDLKAAPPAALPLVTFSDGLSLHLNGQDVRAIHVAHAHTDGDALVWFEQAKVLHMGDLYFNGLYPFIDVDAGGSIHGMIAGVQRALAMIDDRVIVVPGHGPLSNRAELKRYGEMLVVLRDRIAALKAQGKSLQQAIQAKPSAEYDAALGGKFISPELLVELIYRSL
ncbi:MAG: MBL fold metallo-hydrolase [Xanthomonadaceae bacterium]|nr:MBL fold metallo-hydrolase [Xanthomonadaceae bacterium]